MKSKLLLNFLKPMVLLSSLVNISSCFTCFRSMMRTGTPGDVQILAKSNAEPGSAIDPALMKNVGTSVDNIYRQ